MRSSSVGVQLALLTEQKCRVVNVNAGHLLSFILVSN
jgi:hypothetical protein